MRKTLKAFTAATFIAASAAIATASFAATSSDNDSGAGEMGQMMKNKDHKGQGMMGNGPMPMMQMMTEMNQMMSNCNKMMEAKMKKPDSQSGNADKG